MKVIRVVTSKFSTSSYLILTQKPAVIDPGTYTDKIIDTLKKHHVKNLEYIIFTHYHYDHTQDALEIKEKTGAKVIIHELDVPILVKKINTDERYAKLSGLRLDVTVKDGDSINLGNYVLKVIHTPGHSIGSMCLYEPKTKSLFSGDTVFSGGIPGNVIYESGDKEQLIKSLKRLSKLDVKVLYPGHEEVTDEDVNEQIRNSLRFIQS